MEDTVGPWDCNLQALFTARSLREVCLKGRLGVRIAQRENLRVPAWTDYAIVEQSKTREWYAWGHGCRYWRNLQRLWRNPTTGWVQTENLMNQDQVMAGMTWVRNQPTVLGMSLRLRLLGFGRGREGMADHVRNRWPEAQRETGGPVYKSCVKSPATRCK